MTADPTASGVARDNSEPIRIVPMRVDGDLQPAPGGAQAPAAVAHLTFRGGPLLSSAQVFTLFWGQAWQQPDQAALAQNLNQFFDYALTSPLLDQLAEYSVPGQAIGHGSRIGSATVTAPAPAAAVSDADIRQFIQGQIAAGGPVPRPTAETLYFVYLPPGVSVSLGGARSCLNFCGYHDHVNGQLFYAVMPFPGCSGCAGGLATLEALTSTSSHELCEAITDPIPGQGWYDDSSGEIGDICAWQTKQLDAYTVQLEWSNQAGRCL